MYQDNHVKREVLGTDSVAALPYGNSYTKSFPPCHCGTLKTWGPRWCLLLVLINQALRGSDVLCLYYINVSCEILKRCGMAKCKWCG